MRWSHAPLSGKILLSENQKFLKIARKSLHSGHMSEDWHDCPHCIYRHPFAVTDEKPCPNRRISEARCRAIHHKGLTAVLRSGVASLRLRLHETETETIPVSTAVSPWEAQGISRATWFRRHRDP